MSKNIQQSISTLVQQVKENAEKRTDIFIANTHLSKGLLVQGRVGEYRFDFDEPEALGGTNQAPNPVEYLLASLGSCQTIVYRILALGHRVPFDNLKVLLKGNLDLRGFLGIDSNVRPGFYKIEAKTLVTSDEEKEKIERLYENVKRYCPVYDILANEVPVAGNLIITPSSYKEHEEVSSIKEGISQLIEHVKANPEAALSSFETEVILEDRLTNLAKTGNFSFKIDKEESYGGHESAPNPLEYLLASLGACQSIVYKVLAALKGIVLDEVNIQIKGTLDVRGLLAIDDEVRPGYQKIEYTTELVSNEDPEVLKQLAQEVESLCPVLDNILNKTEVIAEQIIQTVEAEIV